MAYVRGRNGLCEGEPFSPSKTTSSAPPSAIIASIVY